MSNKASEWEAQKTSSTVRAQTTSKISIEGTEASISITEYESRKAYTPTTISIVSTEPSVAEPEYERKKAYTPTTISIVSAEPSVAELKYESRKAYTPTTISIVSIEPTVEEIKNESRKAYTPTTISIVSAEPTVAELKYESRKAYTPTTISIVSAEPTVAETKDVVEPEEFCMGKIFAALREVQLKAGQSSEAVPPPIDPMTFSVEEKLTLWRDGGFCIEGVVEGTLSLQILNQADGFIEVQVEPRNRDIFFETHRDIAFETHPNINEELFFNENILALKDPNMPFFSGQAGDDAGGVVLLSWRQQIFVKKSVSYITGFISHIRVDCSPTSDPWSGESFLNVYYDSRFDLQNVMITVPLPDLTEFPQEVHLSGGKCSFVDSSLEWSIPSIDDNNRTGKLKFAVPPKYLSGCFPRSAKYTYANTMSGFKVMNVLPLRDGPAQRIVDYKFE